MASNIKNKNQETLLVLDGHSVLYRAFYALPTALTLESGQVINAVYGFFNMLFLSIDQFSPTHLCICFDRKEPTFRHVMYPEYKAHRSPTPEELISQIPIVKDCLIKMGIKVFEKPGYEADDLIGTISKVSTKNQVKTLIISGDKDLLQLVTDYASVAIMKKGIANFDIYDHKAIKERYNLTPDQLIDLKSLQGDSSDNIPGVAGVGEKTALSLLMQYPSLDEIYENLENIKSKSVKSKLEADKDIAKISYQLATINTKSPIDISIPELSYSPNWQNILSCFHEYKFNNLIRKYQSRVGDSELVVTENKAVHINESIKSGDVIYTVIDVVDGLKKIIKDLKLGFAVDLETTSLITHLAQIVGIAISFKPKEAFYIPLNKYLEDDSPDNEVTIPLFQEMEAPRPKKKTAFKINPFLKLLKPLLEDPGISKITHNGKYEYQVFKNYGIELNGVNFDTMLAAYLLFPGKPVGLKDLANRLLNIQMTTYEELVGKGKTQISFRDVTIEQAINYAATDADLTLRLADYFRPKIEENGLGRLFYEIELPLQIVLGKVEYEGVSLDVEYLRKIESEFEIEIEQARKEVFEISGEEFNLNSPKQLQEILFNKMGLPTQKKTQTGHSTDASVLEKLAPNYEIAKVLLKYRTLEKLSSTYIKALPALVLEDTGRVHTSFNQTVTMTGRLSSSAPNLQNIPIRTAHGGKIRKAFIPSTPENFILSADYSQIELRIIAHLAKDEKMIAAFNNNEDIHTSTASLVFDVPLNEVTKEIRYQAKAVNFGIIYGISVFGLAENLQIPRQESKEIIDNYFLKFPNIKKFMEETIIETMQEKLVKTVFGRIRQIPEIDSPIPARKQFAKRTAINTRVQGTAADIIKIAMINVQNKLEEQKLGSKMIIQVHDELVLDVLPLELQKVRDLVINEMENAVQLSVPLTVDADIGKNWQEMKS
jgi:DNA polymerase I